MSINENTGKISDCLVRQVRHRKDETMKERRSKEESDSLDTAAKGKKTDKFVKRLLKIVALYLCFMVLLVIVFQKILMLSLIPSASMADTLLPGDVIISTRYGIGLDDIDRYDILIFTLPNDPEQEYIKRVIGMPGETIEVSDGKVYADGVELEDSFIKEPMEWYDNDTYVVPEGCFFVMGDNRNNSVDSRYWEEECVPVENVLAREKFTLIRLSRFGYKGEE